MGSTPLVSIVLAAFNEERVVATAVGSIQAQDFVDWELVAVDDGSTDGTLGVLEGLATHDARIRIVRTPSNRGLASALNLGLRSARGELIARMDADDVAEPKRISSQVEFLTGHPEVGIVGTAVELVDDDGNSLGVARRPEDHESLVTRMYKETPFFHPTVVMRREVIEQFEGYDERLRGGGEDVDLWLRAYRTVRFHNLQEPLLRYRVKRHQRVGFLLWNAYALVRGARREGVLLSKGWYAARFLVATMLARLGLRNLNYG